MSEMFKKKYFVIQTAQPPLGPMPESLHFFLSPHNKPPHTHKHTHFLQMVQTPMEAPSGQEQALPPFVTHFASFILPPSLTYL